MQKAYDKINTHTREIINTLRNQAHFKLIGLTHFANICVDLGLSGQMSSALRKLGRPDLLLPNERLVRVIKSVEKLHPEMPQMNASYHGDIHENLKVVDT